MKKSKPKKKPSLRTIPLPLPLDMATLRRFAVLAQVDPRTIRAAAAGLPVKGMAGHRARAVLKREGYPLVETMHQPTPPPGTEGGQP